MSKTCSTCRWWNTRKGETTKGDCQRFPPQIILINRGLFNEINPSFPGTMATVWCGEYQEKDADNG